MNTSSYLYKKKLLPSVGHEHREEQMDKDKAKKIIKGTVIALGATYVVLDVIAKKQKADTTYKNDPDQQNPMQGKKVEFVEDSNDSENADGERGHLEATGESYALTRHQSAYEKVVKRGLDKTLSFAGLVALAPIMGGIALAIKIEDPGPVLFTQKRVGQDKQYFKLHKFRSMKMSTPHDVPTHMLENPESYITKVGGFLRKHSLDELPQIWDIFVGNMSVIGPRPALWNQDVLVAERDKVGANDVKPGLTGWAQINGRDELSLSDKSGLDGVYTRELEKGGLSAAKMDLKCFTGSLHVFGNDDTVVEGGTGSMAASSTDVLRPGVPEQDPTEHFACDYKFTVDHSSHKNVLIVGAGSYIGESFVAYAKEHYSDNFTFTVVDTMPSSSDGLSELDKLSAEQLSSFDIVYHLAGIAHADVGNVSEEVKEKYYKVNTDLAVKTAGRYQEALNAAERKGLFVFMSSMIVYGDSAPYGEDRVITADTTPTPANFYGDSKWQADKGIRSLANETMNVAIIRPPMIYGKGSKGNYPTLSKLARKLPVFPDVSNSRSMLYVGNLCEFLCGLFLSTVDTGETDTPEQVNSLIFMPQNSTYTKTADMVKAIADASGHRIRLQKVLNPVVVLSDHVPGKIKGLVDKAFGNNCYDQKLSVYNGLDYQKYTLEQSIKLTEGSGADSVVNSSTGSTSNTATDDHIDERPGLGKKVLIVASVASMIDQFNKPNIELLESLGYDVDVATNFKDPGTITLDRCKELMQWLADHNVDCYQIDFDRNVADIKADKAAFEEMDRVFKGSAEPISTVYTSESSNGTKVETRPSEKHHTQPTYTFMHCHSPIGGVVGRITAHKNHVKSIYTAHGFHFYDGAPLKNWILFYPVEKELSRITDVLITINKEDYRRAKEKFYARKTVYVPGVGVDVKKFQNVSASIDRNAKREELGVKDSDILLLSVGELNENKNHSVVIKALGELQKPGKLGDNHIVYMIAGTGDKKEELEKLAATENVDLRLLGFRKDVSELLTAADLYMLPSIREGLNVSLMEAMASGTPCLAGNIRGNVDLIDTGMGGELFNPQDVTSVAEAINTELSHRDNWSQQGAYNQNKIKHFDLSVVEDNYKNLIGGVTHKVTFDNGLELPDYKYLSEAIGRQKKRAALGIKNDDYLLISVGELSERKNQIVVLKALAEIKRTQPELGKRIKYILVGKGSREEEYKEYIKVHVLEENVQMLGFRSDIPELLHASDLFVFPSYQEGLPVALMEALSSGIGVICSKIRGNTDLVSDGLFDPDDVDEVVSLIIEAVGNRNDRDNHNPEIIRKRFSKEKVQEDMQEIYTNVWAI